jgi:hypothetical protein
MVLGPKAKTNFPFDPRDSSSTTPYMPIPTLVQQTPIELKQPMVSVLINLIKT